MAQTDDDAALGTKLIAGLLALTGLGFLAVAGLTLMIPAYISAYTGASGLIMIGLPAGLGVLAGLAFLSAYDLVQVRRRGWLIAIYTYAIALALDLSLALATPQPLPAIRLILTLAVIGYLASIRDRFCDTDDSARQQRQPPRQDQPDHGQRRQQRPRERQSQDRSRQQ